MYSSASSWFVSFCSKARSSTILKISEKQINHKAYDLADDIRSEFLVPGQAASVFAGEMSLGIVGLVSPHIVESRGAPRQLEPNQSGYWRR